MLYKKKIIYVRLNCCFCTTFIFMIKVGQWIKIKNFKTTWLTNVNNMDCNINNQLSKPLTVESIG